MDQILDNAKESQELELSIESEITNAIETLLNQYKDRKKGLRILSNKMGIHEKTLNRILNFENKPGYQTVFKIYRVVYNEFNDAKVLSLVPKNIQEYLLKSNSQEINLEKNYSVVADLELQKNPIISEIYILAATGPITYDQIEVRFGKYGLELVNKMLEKELLQESHKNVLTTGTNHPVFNAETIVAVGSAMISTHAKPAAGEELDQNFISFYAEGLSDSAYKKWIALDHEVFMKKCELARDINNHGNNRAFTFMITEKIELENLQ